MAYSMVSRQTSMGWRYNCLTQETLVAAPPRMCAARPKSRDIQANGFGFGSSGTTATRQQQTAIVAIDPSAPSSTVASSSSPTGAVPMIAIAVGAVGLLAMFVKKLRSGGLDDNTARYSVNMHLANVMKDVNTVRIEDLSTDQIEAARARRSKERANHKLSLEEIDLPQNHPFATKQVLSKEEQEQSLQNLRARSMRRRNWDAMQAAAEGSRTGPGAIGRQR